MTWFQWLFSNTGFMPRAICGIWTPGMIFLHNASDFLIWTAYIAIPLVLAKFAYAKRSELPFRRLFWLFGLFILACGTTHFMDIVMFYDPLYRLAGFIKLITAVASWGTVFALFHVTPLALQMRSPEALEREIEQRQNAEALLQQANDNLEIRVQERTATLAQTNSELQLAKKEAESANAAKDEFLSRMSHELRTPLNAILGFGQILEMQEEDLKPLLNESVQQILKAGRHQLDLVNEVLDITRIQAPDSALSPEAVSLSEVVREALDMLQSLAAPDRISLTHQLADAPPIFVLADRQRLLQILINLLSNAIKYNKPMGQVTVSAEVLTENRVRLDVRDTGHGIATEDLPKLFVPFSRLKAEKLGVEGTGLGLVLCQRLALAMNGSLHVESQLEQGSTFSVELPLAQPPTNESSTEMESANFTPSVPLGDEAVDTSSTAPLAKPTVLLIEDNISNFQLMERILDKLCDVRLVGAMQGGLGVELAVHHRPDLILLDVHLPDIMGDEVLRRLQANPETQNIPVIVLSADATPSQINRLLTLGARQYLTKPLDVKQFVQAVEETLHTP